MAYSAECIDGPGPWCSACMFEDCECDCHLSTDCPQPTEDGPCEECGQPQEECHCAELEND